MNKFHFEEVDGGEEVVPFVDEGIDSFGKEEGGKGGKEK